MGLIDDDQEVIGEEVHQGQGRRSLGHGVQVPGVVLDAGAEACLPQHLDVEVGPLRDALGFNQLVLPLEEAHSLFQLFLDIVTGGLYLVHGHHVVGGREDGDVTQHRVHPAGEGLHLGDAVDFVPEELNPDEVVPALGRVYLYDVPVHPKAPSVHVHLVAGVLDVHQLPQHLVAVLHHPGAQGDHHALVFFRAAQAVDAGHAGHHHHVPALCQGDRGGKTELLYLVVDGGVLGDVGVGGGHVGFRLVVVVVGHKIFYRVLRKKFLELAVELAGQGLIVGYDQGGLVKLCNHVGHGESLAAAGNAQQSLELVAFLKALDQLGYGCGLVACGFVFGMKFEAFLCILHNTTSLHL